MGGVGVGLRRGGGALSLAPIPKPADVDAKCLGVFFGAFVLEGACASFVGIECGDGPVVSMGGCLQAVEMPPAGLSQPGCTRHLNFTLVLFLLHFRTPL